jgi:hypothetical protein
LPDPDVLAREIMEDLQAALAQFTGIIEEFEKYGNNLFLQSPLKQKNSECAGARTLNQWLKRPLLYH